MSDEPQNLNRRIPLRDEDRRAIQQEQDGCIKAASVLILCIGIIAYMCL